MIKKDRGEHPGVGLVSLIANLCRYIIIIINVISYAGFSVHHGNCSFGHTPDSLCCKTGVEFDYYYKAVEEGNYYE